MQTRSKFLALLTVMMWSTRIEAHVIDAPWFAPNSHSAATDMKLHESFHCPTLQSGGLVSTEAWEEEWNVPLPAGASAKDVLKSINDIWAAEKNWTNVSRADNSDMSVWEFIDKTGNRWITTARAESNVTRDRCVCSIIITLKVVGSSTSDQHLATRKKIL